MPSICDSLTYHSCGNRPLLVLLAISRDLSLMLAYLLVLLLALLLFAAAALLLLVLLHCPDALLRYECDTSLHTLGQA